MVAWTAYLLAVAAIVSVAGLILERALRQRQLATRWIWLGALCGSIVLPVVLASVSQPTAYHLTIPHASPAVTPAAPSATGRSRPWTDWSAPLPGPLSASATLRLDAVVARVWGGGSALAATIFLSGWWYGYRRRRRWRRAVVDGTALFVAADAGPATVGLLRPRIVVPEWLLAAPPETRRLVLAHERSHIAAGDPALWGLGLAALILMPWNAFLWWQVRRLRLAIEVDCDRRVLRFGHDVRRYARTLVDVSTRRPAYLGALAASSHSSSTIERRIMLMNAPRIHGWRASAAAGALAAAVAAATLLISPPAIPVALAAVTTPAAAAPAEPADLSRYVGDYEFATTTVLRIELRSGQLAQVFGRGPPEPLTHLSGQLFRVGKAGCCGPDGDAYIRFATDPAGRVIGAVFQQNGVATTAPRIGAQRVLAIDSSIGERVRAQTPAPGSEAALRQLILGIESGNPNYGELSPQLAAGTKAMLGDLQATMKPWGALRSLEFRGVDPDGWDKYLVHFDRGSAAWSIALDSYGLIVGAGTHPEK